MLALGQRGIRLSLDIYGPDTSNCDEQLTAGVVGHWLIGFLVHNQGAMSYRVEDAAMQGRNIRFTSLLTMGESWHNNHHAFPGSAKLGLLSGEWDPGWWALLDMKRMGLVWDIKLPENLPARPELRTLPVAVDAVPAITAHH